MCSSPKLWISQAERAAAAEAASIFARKAFSYGIQGGIVPVAAGLALTLRVRKPDHIGVVFIGDGTLGEGFIYEAMNIISKWDLPLLIVLEHNLHAQSTSHTQTLAGDICAPHSPLSESFWR
jgi:TPP-dependent pyruvate/acetoin dehydrogenase alpha subunit